MKTTLVTAALAAAGLMVMPAATWAAAADLTNCCTAGDKDFPKVGGNLGNQNFSALNAINRLNVRNLGGAWLTRVNGGVASANQSTPVVVNGVIFLEVAGNVVAVDGKTGAVKWTAAGKTGNTRRGLAVAKDLGVGADLNLTHRADPILTRGWKPTA